MLCSIKLRLGQFWVLFAKVPAKITGAMTFSIMALSRMTLNMVVLSILTMEQHALKNVNDCLNTNIYCALETFGGQSSNQYLNAVHFFNTSFN
jgi:hypothetical protein